MKTIATNNNISLDYEDGIFGFDFYKNGVLIGIKDASEFINDEKTNLDTNVLNMDPRLISLLCQVIDFHIIEDINYTTFSDINYVKLNNTYVVITRQYDDDATGKERLEEMNICLADVKGIKFKAQVDKMTDAYQKCVKQRHIKNNAERLRLIFSQIHLTEEEKDAINWLANNDETLKVEAIATLIDRLIIFHKTNKNDNI